MLLTARRPVFAVLLAALLVLAASPAHAEPPLLVVLKQTGERAGLPVCEPDPAAGPVVRILSRGYSGRLIRLYRYEQTYVSRHGGPAPAPAYLLLSNNQGGFPRAGFYLGNVEKRQAGYVDLYRRDNFRPRFGGIDQIFPHELLHVIVAQLAGPPRDQLGQVHAIAVRTNPVTAFQEGFAEHAQVLAIDDVDADPQTARLARDQALERHVEERLAAYRRELTSRIGLTGAARLTFLLWFSGGEQLLRYHAVKANRFALAPSVPARLLATDDPWAAYLLENVLPGQPGDRPRTLPQMLSSEGVVSAFFYRWMTTASIRDRYEDEAFYQQFGVDMRHVDPMENAYLKLFAVLAASKPADTRQLVEAYRVAYPEEATAIDAVVRETFQAERLVAPKPIWIANRAFRVGRSLFDQFRSMPQVHVFDLNAASETDLVAVPGVDLATARAIIAHMPYGDVGDLSRVPGVPPAVAARFGTMSAEMSRAAGGGEEGLSLGRLLRPLIVRAVMWLLVCGLLSAWCYRRVRAVPAWRAALAGAGAALVGLPVGWALGPGPVLQALAAPLLVFAIPGAVWAAVRAAFRARAGAGRGGWAPVGAGGRVLLAWGAAVLPVIVILTPF